MSQLSPLTSHFSPPPAALLHNPTLSVWLSVDPLSDKYPGASPYVYCGNNPVRLVDVDGRDIYEFDNHGNYIQCISYEYDVVRIINNEIGDVVQSKEYEKGTIFGLETNIQIQSKNPDLQSANLFQVHDAEESNQIFEFVADHTEVEWSIVQDAGKNSVCTNFIGTNCNTESINIISVIDHRGYSLDGRCAHSHPNGDRIPSESDIDNAHEREQKHISIQHYTYTSAHGYLPYNGESSYIGKDRIPHSPKVYEK